MTNEEIKKILDGAPDGERYCNVPILSGLGVAIHNLTDLREILELRQEVERLKAHVERFRKAVIHFNRSRGHINPLLEAFTATPQQTLNAVKREAWIKGYKQTTEYYNGSNRSHDWIAGLANTKYPTEGE